RYSPRTHEQLSLFLETIEDPAMRYFAELIVLGAFDPAPELREADASYPGRAGRLAAAAKRFTEIDFGASPRGALVRERVIQQITSTDPSASILESLLEKEYRAENCLTYCNLGNHKKIEHASRPLGAFAALRLRSGDTSVVEDMIAAANHATGNDYYRRSALRYFSLRLLDSLKHRAPQAKPEEWAAYSTALGLLLSETKDEILEHNSIATIIGAHLAASARSGRVAEFTAWANALPPDRAETLARKIRRTPLPCWTSFGQILKTKAPDPAIRPGPEAREQMLSTLVVNPLIDRTYRLHDPFFRFAVDHGMLSVEEVRAEPGKRLEALFPRNGYSAIEIARYHADAGEWDAALEWAAKSLTRLKPDKLGGPYARIAMRRIEILLEAQRGSEAKNAISELEAKVDFTKLPADLRQSHATLRKRIKS
ncbi:MAG: hypothetical protein GXX91_11230, partial [Verrucomicrobiaceae bacterium]|nr:hypothetical protein [Verrucomicrobiaceae bacterium]